MTPIERTRAVLDLADDAASLLAQALVIAVAPGAEPLPPDALSALERIGRDAGTLVKRLADVERARAAC